MTADPNQQTARVFISYSHDSDEHRSRVLELAQDLRRDGIDCELDQFVHGGPPEGWPRWMRTQLEQADHVLVVCTHTYRRSFDGDDSLEYGRGHGVNWEATLVAQHLYDAKSVNTKFIPVLYEDGSTEDVPLVLRPFSRYSIPHQYSDLYRVLTGQPAITKSPLGERRQVDSPSASPPAKPWPKAALVVGATLLVGVIAIAALLIPSEPEEPIASFKKELTSPASLGQAEVSLHQATPAAKTLQVSDVDVRNATIETPNFCSDYTPSRVIKFSSGNASWENKEDEWDSTTYEMLSSKVLRYEGGLYFTIAMESVQGNGGCTNLALYQQSGQGKLKAIGTLIEGDAEQLYIGEVFVEPDHLAVFYLNHAPEDPRCCPTRPTLRTFNLHEEQLTLKSERQLSRLEEGTDARGTNWWAHYR